MGISPPLTPTDSLKRYGHGLENHIDPLLAWCQEEGAVFMYELHQNLADAIATLLISETEKKQLLPQLAEIREYGPDPSEAVDFLQIVADVPDMAQSIPQIVADVPDMAQSTPQIADVQDTAQSIPLLPPHVHVPMY